MYPMTVPTTAMESENLTSLNPDESETENNFFLGFMYLTAGLLVMVSNGVVLFVITRTKLLRQPTLWVLNHMAFWDFVMGIFNIVIPVPSALLNRFAYPERYLGVVACLITYFVSILFFNVATVVLDRLVCLRFPIAYANLKKRTYVFAAIFVHVLAVCRALFVSFPDMDFYYNKVAGVPLSDYGNIRETLFSIGFIAVALIVIIVCSFLIVHTVKQRRQRIGKRRANIISRSNIKLSTMTVVSAAVFCVSFVPLVTTICWNLAVGHGKIPNWVIQVMILCLVSNSIWNVLIYAATYRPFRESLIYIFCRSYYRKMLRKRHGIKSTIEKGDTVSHNVSQASKMETLSVEDLSNKSGSSGRLQVPTHLFIASGAK